MNEFVIKMLELGAELDKAVSPIEKSMVLKDAKSLYKNHIEELSGQPVSQEKEILKEIFDLTAGAWDDPVISEDLYNRMKIAVSSNKSALHKTAVMRSVYAVYPDGERLDIGQNRLSAIFRYKDHAEEFAKSKWGEYYIIEKMSSEHFA